MSDEFVSMAEARRVNAHRKQAISELRAALAAVTADRDRLAAENARMKEALAPFSALADEIERLASQYPRTSPESDPSGWAKACQWDDLVAARAALTGDTP